MVQSLKRKRTEKSSARKTQKLQDPSEEFQLDINDEASINGDDHSASDDEDLMHEDDQHEEEWGGISGEQTVEAVTYEHRTGTKPKKPPTGHELRAIKDAADLFKSGSFKLQIDALLPNVRPKPSRIPPLESFLFVLHSFIMGIPSTAPQHPLEGARKLLKKGVAVPYSLPLPTEETNWKVAFDPPSDIILVGSWANKVSVKPKDDQKLGVDLAIEMPDSLFQEKDYLNGRFFHKRSFYLATIAAAIQNPKSKLDIDVSYESWLGDPRLTKLVLTPRNNDSQTNFTKLNAKICILPVLSSTSPIPIHRLSPSHANIRANAINDTADTNVQPSNNPTPLYNNAILRNLTPKSQLLAVHSLQKDCAAFADALALLRIWANQRGYSEGTRMCIRGFEGSGPWWWSVLALLLTGEESRPGATKANKRRTVGKGVSSYQLFKAALEFLAKHDFQKERVFVKTTDGHHFSHEEYSGHREAVFVDSSSLTNLLAGVPLGSLDLLRYDAAKTLESLNDTTFSGDPFTGVFLKDSRDLATRFDVILRVNLSSVKPRRSSVHDALDYGSPQNAFLSSLTAIIRQGLGDRSRAVTILHPSSTSRSTSQAHPSTPDVIFIGIVHNPQHAFHLVDHGPAADDQDQVALEQFRDFWGDKSELRRFKDGRIVESVVWEVTTADEMAHVPSMVVRHLLNRHFNIGEGDVETWQTSFDSVLRLPQSISQEYLASKISTGFKGALAAFDDLVKAIKKLDDLPLALLNISPASEFLRYTSVFSPVPLPRTFAALLPENARYLAPMDIIIEFEKSSKWPDDLKAIQTIKLAFFERLASALMESVSGLKANVVVSDGVHISEILDKACLEIITPDGWAFSAHIWHDREVNLLDRIISGNGNLQHIVVKKQTNKKSAEYFEALEAKEIYLRRFIHAPRHHRAIAALYHHYSAFSGTVRLVKRWLASHWLLQCHISEEVVEIICASFFVGGGRTSIGDMDTEQASQHLVPGSKERGFSAVVQFLKEWKWEDGLVVPLYGLPSANLSDASSITPLVNNVIHKGVWRISTEYDKEGRVWTCDGPDLVVAHRVRSLADATWKCLQTLERAQIDIKTMFLHSTDDYDLLVQLDPTILPRYFHNINPDNNLLLKRGKYANKPNEKDMAVLPGFDPARLLLSDLQRMYADTFKIFYDSFGGDRFGVVWDPSLKEPRPFRVLGGFSSQPVKKENDKSKDKALVNLNQDGIISEIERVGAGLVQKITIQS